MNDILLIARYELKMQSRNFLFHVLVLLSLVGITYCQFILQCCHPVTYED